MNQEIRKTECGFVVTDTIGDLNPDLVDKVAHNTNGMDQLLEIEGVELRFDQTVSEDCDNAKMTSVCTKWFEKDSLTNEDLKQVHKAHDRIIETISAWSLKRSKIKSSDPKPQKEPTPYELWCKFLDDEKRDEMGVTEFTCIIAKALGYEPSILVLRLIASQMTREYERNKENQKL